LIFLQTRKSETRCRTPELRVRAASCRLTAAFDLGRIRNFITAFNPILERAKYPKGLARQFLQLLRRKMDPTLAHVLCDQADYSIASEVSDASLV
jgi:hypothetical protein